MKNANDDRSDEAAGMNHATEQVRHRDNSSPDPAATAIRPPRTPGKPSPREDAPATSIGPT